MYKPDSFLKSSFSLASKELPGNSSFTTMSNTSWPECKLKHPAPRCAESHRPRCSHWCLALSWSGGLLGCCPCGSWWSPSICLQVHSHCVGDWTCLPHSSNSTLHGNVLAGCIHFERTRHLLWWQRSFPQSPAEFNRVPAFWLLSDLCCQSLPSAASSGNLPKYICCIDQASTDQRQCMGSSARISDLWIADFGRARRSIWPWATLDEDSSDGMLSTRMLSARQNAPPSPWRMRGRYFPHLS